MTGTGTRQDETSQVQLLDTGHSATETHVVEIAAALREFLDANFVSPARRE